MAVFLLLPSTALSFAIYCLGWFLENGAPISLAVAAGTVALTAILTLIHLHLTRHQRTVLPADVTWLTLIALCFVVFVRGGLHHRLMLYVNRNFLSESEVYAFVLMALPCAYIALACLRNVWAHVRQKTVVSGSLTARLVRFLGRGKTLRRRLLIKILAVQLLMIPCMALAWALLTNFADVLSSGAVISIWIVLPALIESVLLILFFVSPRSTGAEMERIGQAIADSAQGRFPEKNPVPPTSPLHETGEALIELGRVTEDGIRRGIAGEKLKVELITNVSHDLRTPLTSIVGYGEELERRADLPAEAADTARALTAKAKYLTAMVNDLFDLAKTASGAVLPTRGELDLCRLIEQTLAEMNDRIAASGFALRTDLGAAQARILADGMRLHRVVQNLLDNALKYSLPGTRIYLTARNEGDTVTVSLLNTASYEMAFGEGTDLTARFTRGDAARTGEGSGLGLAIAKTYVEAMGGRFDIIIRGDSFEARMSFPTVGESVRDSTENDQ